MLTLAFSFPSRSASLGNPCGADLNLEPGCYADCYYEVYCAATACFQCAWSHGTFLSSPPG